MAEVTEFGIDNIFENPNITRKVLDLCADGMMIVNREGIITYVNKSFEEIHNIPKEKAVGQHVTKIIENTRMHIVAQTATPELDRIQTIKNQEVIVSRIPIIENGQCVGVVGKIKYLTLEEVKALTKSILKLEEKLRRGDTRIPDTRFTFNDILAVSPSSQNLKKTAMMAASSNATILLLGESGVGKEVFAHSIHALSSRCSGPFIRLNCSAIQEELFEAELFGYEEGALSALCDYSWPGNIRELRNVLERALILVLQETITADHINTIIFGETYLCPAACALNPDCKLKILLESTEKAAISQALVTTNNNRRQAAKKLGISRALLYKRLHYYGLVDR